jgi:hypothetical protein
MIATTSVWGWQHQKPDYDNAHVDDNFSQIYTNINLILHADEFMFPKKERNKEDTFVILCKKEGIHRSYSFDVITKSPSTAIKIYCSAQTKTTENSEFLYALWHRLHFHTLNIFIA